MTNEQILKAITTAGGVGIAAPQDAQEFIDLAVEQTQVLQKIRVETGIKSSMNIDSLLLGEPVIVSETEGTAVGAGDVIDPARVRKALTPLPVVAAFDVSFSFLRRNIEGERVNESLNRLFAKRFGKDLVLGAFMGDSATAGTTRTAKALRTTDGFVKQMLADATVNDVVIGATPNYSGTVFKGILGAMPKDYRDQRDDLLFFVSSDVYEAYAAEIGARATALGDLTLAGKWGEGALSYMGVPLCPVFGLATGRIVLTLGQNLCIGFGNEMTVGRDVDNRAGLVKVTIRADYDVKFAVGEAIVLGAAA